MSLPQKFFLATVMTWSLQQKKLRGYRMTRCVYVWRRLLWPTEVKVFPTRVNSKLSYQRWGTSDEMNGKTKGSVGGTIFTISSIQLRGTRSFRMIVLGALFSGSRARLFRTCSWMMMGGVGKAIANEGDGGESEELIEELHDGESAFWGS